MAARGLLERRIVRYGFAVGAVALAFVLRSLLDPLTGPGARFALFFGAILASALLMGPTPGIVAVILSVPLGASFIIREGFAPHEVATQAALFAVDAVVVVYLSFITVRAQRAAERATERVQQLLDLAPDAIVVTSPTSDVVDVNEAACRLLGYERTQLIGKPLRELLPAEAHQQLDADRVALAGRSHVIKREWSMCRSDGTEVPVEVSATVLPDQRGQAFIRDITDRRRIERDLQFLADAGVTLISLDPQQTVVQLAQLAVREVAECCLIQVAGANGARSKVVRSRSTGARMAARLDAETTQLALISRVATLRRSVLIEHVDLDVLDRDAAQLRLFQEIQARSVMAIPLETRGVLFAVMLLVSSTSGGFAARELRLAESLAGRAALAIDNGRLYETAVQATRLRDQVLGIVAHDLRNPLDVARLQLESLRLVHPELESKPLDAIMRSTDRMIHLIEELLDVTRIEAGVFRIDGARLAPGQLLVDALDAQRLLAERASIDLRIAPCGDLPDVWGDPARLCQVLENLIGNAIKFTPPGGAITLGAVLSGDFVQIWVTDTGLGIAPEALPHVFDRFWQANKTTRSGAGLGLPIARGIIEAHGGRIWAESTPGHGATFHVTIPRTAGFGIRDATDRTTPEPAHQRRRA